MSLDACHPAPAARAHDAPHWAHVGVVAMHTLCCGLPLLVSALGLMASAGLAAGVTQIHALLHDRELWLLAVSGALVGVGGLAEWRALSQRRQRRISMLFAASLACFALNAGLIASHRAVAAPAEIAATLR